MNKFAYRANEASGSHRTPFIETIEGRTLMSVTALPYVETAPSDLAATADSTAVVQKVRISDISIVKQVDKSSPVLFNY